MKAEEKFQMATDDLMKCVRNEKYTREREEMIFISLNIREFHIFIFFKGEQRININAKYSRNQIIFSFFFLFFWEITQKSE